MNTKVTLQSLTSEVKFRDVWIKDFRADNGMGALICNADELTSKFMEIHSEAAKNGEYVRLNLRYFENDLYSSDVTFSGDRYYMKYTCKPLYLSDVVLVHTDDGVFKLKNRVGY